MIADTPSQPLPTDGRRSLDAARTRRRGFTLIELLIVISIIALLIGILIPTIGFARTKARDAACVANVGGIMPAWHLYALDHNGKFPSNAVSPEHLPENAHRWATASVFVGTNMQGDPRQMRAAILNQYLGMESKTRARTNLLRCPRDKGAIYSANKLTLRQGDGGVFEYLEDDGSDDSHFFLRGNSYWANDWMWCNIGSADGAGPSSLRKWNHTLRADAAITHPSLTVTIGDAGSLDAGALTDEALDDVDAILGWWHGERVCNVGMWDGSAKRLEMTPGGYGTGYRLWLQPDKHPDDGTPVGKFWTTRFSTSDYANSR
jgi:prepilin-type N-terminal cleavage/methylation domain-containing protein/prepilin-type processing-associated H-X9-DG protein